VLYRGLEKNGMVKAWHGKCESDTAALSKSNGKETFYTLSRTAWVQHAVCESALTVPYKHQNTSEPFLFWYLQGHQIFYSKYSVHKFMQRVCLSTMVQRMELKQQIAGYRVTE
jgi:hypothetical protein